MFFDVNSDVLSTSVDTTTVRVNDAWHRLTERISAFVDTAPVILVAIGVFVALVLLGRLIVKWNGLFGVLSSNKLMRATLKHLTMALFVLTGALLALEILDATKLVGTVLGAAGLAGLAIGFAFRDIVENYLASILLAVRRPFEAKDNIRINDHEGTVVSLSSRSTVLMTLDGNHLRLPNSTVFKAVIENYSRNPMRRFHFEVGAGTNEDLTAAQKLGVETLLETPGVSQTPKPFSRVEALGDSTVSLEFFGWVDQRDSDYYAVRSEAIRRVKVAFDDAQIEMPEPTYRVVVKFPTKAEQEKDQHPHKQGKIEDAAHDVSPNRDMEEQIEETGDAVNESENLLIE